MPTNVPQIQWTATGPQIPSEADVLAGVQQDISVAFGVPMNFTTNTPQGLLATSIAASISNCYALVNFMVNGMDPDTNDTFMQDVIARIYFLNRDPATATIVTCTCTGAVGASIPTGALAQDTASNAYACVAGGVIDATGSISLQFANTVTGAIPCPAGTLTTIYQGVPGWESITNPAAGTIGQNIESREAFEYRREQTIAANGHGSLDSIGGAVFEVPGVEDVYVTENTTSSPITVGSTAFSLAPHSLYVGVIGGDPQAIANAIWSKKDVGCDYNGNTTETVVDSSYDYPQPSYTVKFNDNTESPANYTVTVNIAASTALPSTIKTDVQAAVAAEFNGTSSTSQGVRIGALLLASRFYGPVATCEGPSVPVSVLSIFLGTAFTGLATIVDASTTLTITTASSGTLTCGTPVTGTGIPSGTYIVQQLTGTAGAAGTYQMSAPATATVSTPEAISGAAAGVSALVGINQDPNLAACVVNLI